MSLGDYGREEILAKRLFCLLPFYILKYERQREEIAGDPERLGELLEEYKEIRRHLEEAFRDEEHSGMYADLVDLIRRIADYVFEKKEEVRKGVGEVMGGQILKLRSEILREEGREEFICSYIQEKIEDGYDREAILSRLVKRYHLNPEEAEARYRKYSLQFV